MKKQLLTLALMVFTSVAFAQDYKAFKVGLGLGYAGAPDGEGGIAVYLEPAYRVSDEIAIGLRMETAVLLKGVSTDGTTIDSDGSASANGSFTLNGQYYLSNEKFRPFVGLGLGLYSLASVEIAGDDGALSAGTEFGFYPRVGFDYGHLNLIFDYNFIPNTDGTIDINTNPQEVEIKNSYFTIKLGVSIGGGSK